MLNYLIKNAVIIEGTGSPMFHGAVGIKGDRIVSIIKDDSLPDAEKVIDAKGKLLCPGFIDIHSHADLSIAFYPAADNNIMQGITTFVGGNCGQGLAPAYDAAFIETYMMDRMQLRGLLDIHWKTFGEWISFMKSVPIGPNYVPLVGHNAIRGSVLGADNSRVSTPEEEDRICDMVNEALDAGAFGFTYIADPGYPGHWASRSEMQKIFRLLEKRGSYISVHTRHHQNQWPSDDGRNYYGVYVGEPGEVLCGRYHGFVEFLELLRETPKLRAVYSHLTSAFPLPVPHSQALENAVAEETLHQLVDEPIAEGLDIYFNLIPHEHSLSSIQRCAHDLTCSLKFDAELKAYTDENVLVEALNDASFRKKLKDYINSGKFKMGMLCPATDPYWSDCFTFFTAKDKSLVNRTLMDVTKERVDGTLHDCLYNDCLEVLFDLICEDPELEWALTRDKREYQGIKRLLQHPRCMPMTDSPAFLSNSNKWLSPMGYGNPPLAYSVFVRYLVDICREEKLLSTEEAIRRITSMPADIMRIPDRGRIQENMRADLVLLDWNELDYTVDFSNPSTPPTGIEYVFVNGVPALEESKLTHALTGRVLIREEK